jgi:acyl-coenzyme A thioesterase PaaI-like protein
MLLPRCCSSMKINSHKKNVSMSLIQKIQSVPAISKFFLNRYAPYKGAGIEVEHIDFKNYYIRVKMPLTSKNRNIVGVHFGGSLYSMVDPFYMLLLMHHLGNKYIVWDKAASIQFLSPGRSTVYADIRLSADEIQTVKNLTEDYAPIHREYDLDIYDDRGTRIAIVHKTVYIRRKKSQSKFK